MLWLNEKQVDERKCLGFSSWSSVFCKKLSKWLILHMSLTGLDQADLSRQFLRLLTVEPDVLFPIWWQKAMKEIKKVYFGIFTFWHISKFQICGNSLIFSLENSWGNKHFRKNNPNKDISSATEEVTGFLSSKRNPQLFSIAATHLSHFKSLLIGGSLI